MRASSATSRRLRRSCRNRSHAGACAYKAQAAPDRGSGIELMRQLVLRVEIVAGKAGTTVRLLQHLSGANSPPRSTPSGKPPDGAASAVGVGQAAKRSSTAMDPLRNQMLTST